MGHDRDPVDSHAQDHLWSALSSPVDMLALRQALTAGADPNAHQHHTELTPLEAAVEAGCVAACQFLIDHGARLDPQAVDDGRGLLHRAIAALPPETRHPVMKVLMDAGADPHALTHQGQSVLDWARMWGDEDLIQRLRTDQPPDTI